LKLAYVLAYRAPDYIRTQTLLAALSQCPGIEVIPILNKSTGLLRYTETLFALWRVQRRQRPDVYLLGFRGHEIFWLVRWMTRGKTLIFDAMMSPVTALAEENKAGMVGKWLSPLFHRFERNILRASDLVLTDTVAHARLYVEKFGISANKILAVPVAAIEPTTAVQSISFESRSGTNQELSVLFYGSMLSLHGVDVILGAASKVSDLPVRFDFIGGGARQAARLHRECRKKGIKKYTYQRWVPLDRLISEVIPSADLVLGGPFGNTPQARRVVTTKTMQALALGKVVVVGEGEEQIGFRDRFNCFLVPQVNPIALASAIRWAHENREKLAVIGQRGLELYRERFSISVVTRLICGALNRLERYGPF